MKYRSPITPIERTFFKELLSFFSDKGFNTRALYTPELDVMVGVRKKLPMDLVRRLVDKKSEKDDNTSSAVDNPSIDIFYNRNPLSKSDNSKIVSPKAVGIELFNDDNRTYNVFKRQFTAVKIEFELALVLYDTEASDLVEFLLLAELAKTTSMTIPYKLSFDNTDDKKVFQIDYIVKFSSINDVSFVEESAKGNLKSISITVEIDGSLISPYTVESQGETNYNLAIEACGIYDQTEEPFECLTLVDTENGINILNGSEATS